MAFAIWKTGDNIPSVKPFVRPLYVTGAGLFIVKVALIAKIVMPLRMLSLFVKFIWCRLVNWLSGKGPCCWCR